MKKYKTRAEIYYFITLREFCRLYNNERISQELLISKRKQIISQYKNFYLWDIISLNHFDIIKSLPLQKNQADCEMCDKLKGIIKSEIISYKEVLRDPEKFDKKMQIFKMIENEEKLNTKSCFFLTDEFYFFTVKQLYFSLRNQIISDDLFKNEKSIIDSLYNQFIKYDILNKHFRRIENRIQCDTKEIMLGKCEKCKDTMYKITGLS